MRATRIIAVLFLAVISIQAISIDNDKYFEILKNIEIFTNVYKELNTNYVDDIDPNKLMRTGIDAMVNSLDPFTNYISESQVESYRISNQGRYEGVGAIIRNIGDEVTIIEPYKNSAADKAGLKAGDVILAINGNNAKGKTSTEVIEFMRGAPGTDVVIDIKRPGEDNPISISLNRNEVKIPNVPFFGEIDNGIGYINLTTFTAAAGKNVGDALRELKEDSDALKGVILDLRNNGGGLLIEAVNLCNVFIPVNEEVVSTKGKVKDRNRTFKTRTAPVDIDIPVVVLINKRSASASEIVSGVLQDYDRAVIMGQLSYGKGLVQNTKQTGYNSKVKLTTSKYYIPSGRCIQSVEYENGEPKPIDDEKRAKFKTRNGRIVLDGGGVKPDIKLDIKKDSDFLKAIDKEQIVFNFVTDYLLQHEVPLVEEQVNFTDYDVFKSWMANQAFEYTTGLETEWLEFVEEAEDDQLLKNSIQSIEDLIQKQKEDDLDEFKAELTRRIEVDLATRINYQEGKVRQKLKNDSEIDAAIAMLRDETQMKAILDGTQSSNE